MSLVKKYGKKKTLELLKQMIMMRRFEEKAGQMYGLRKIGGFCHLYIGEEAVAAGSIGALDMKKDYILGGTATMVLHWRLEWTPIQLWRNSTVRRLAAPGEKAVPCICTPRKNICSEETAL